MAQVSVLHHGPRGELANLTGRSKSCANTEPANHKRDGQIPNKSGLGGLSNPLGRDGVRGATVQPLTLRQEPPAWEAPITTTTLNQASQLQIGAFMSVQGPKNRLPAGETSAGWAFLATAEAERSTSNRSSYPPPSTLSHLPRRGLYRAGQNVTGDHRRIREPRPCGVPTA